jgi:curved DNA-binding protein CbpA
VSFYEVLGVDPNASGDEIRRVYLDLARRNHPDYHEGSSPDTRAAAQRRMQLINEAWATLGDAARREAYDLDLRASSRTRARPDPTSGVVATDIPTREWQPIDGELDDVDPRELVDDRPYGDGSRPPRALTFAPAFFFFVALASVSVGLVTRIGFLLALGVSAFLLMLLSLLAAPAVALTKSWRTERVSGR